MGLVFYGDKGDIADLAFLLCLSMLFVYYSIKIIMYNSSVNI